MAAGGEARLGIVKAVNRLTIVTGGSSGIGAELARQSAEEGRDVLVVSRRPGSVGRHLAADLAESAGWDVVSTSLGVELEDVGDVELFHCAGVLTPIGFAGEVDPIEYRRNVILNGATPAILGDAFLRAVSDLDVEATLVLITSGAAQTAYPGWSGYCAGKAAVDHWTRTVGAEQSERKGAKVVAIAPGVVDTPMQREIRRTDSSDFPSVDRFRQMHAEGELRDPAAVARHIRAVLGSLESGAVVDLRDLQADPPAGPDEPLTARN
jgi:NAD(P)-dependent dehydrogenase (short-subunit alcohol dehydrogenase family)